MAAAWCQTFPELSTVHAPDFVSEDARSANVLGLVRPDSAVDVREPIEAADRREPSINGGWCKASFFEGCPVQLDVATGSVENIETCVRGPLEVGPKVVTVCLKSPPAVASQECSGRQVPLVRNGRTIVSGENLGYSFQGQHLHPPSGE
jgi:hypothetical protein